MKPKPPCPRCNTNTYVKTDGGGSPGQYRYICNSVQCGGDEQSAWQQIPPHRLKIGDIVTITPVRRSKRMGPYNCKHCGKRKKNHRCLAIDSGEVSVYEETEELQLMEFNETVHLASPVFNIPVRNLQTC